MLIVNTQQTHANPHIVKVYGTCPADDTDVLLRAYQAHERSSCST